MFHVLFKFSQSFRSWWPRITSQTECVTNWNYAYTSLTNYILPLQSGTIILSFWHPWIHLPSKASQCWSLHSNGHWAEQLPYPFTLHPLWEKLKQKYSIHQTCNILNWSADDQLVESHAFLFYLLNVSDYNCKW